MRITEQGDTRLNSEGSSRLSYSIHPGCTKMNKDLKVRFWWEKMREHIAEYVA
jgi:hypothetical protein